MIRSSGDKSNPIEFVTKRVAPSLAMKHADMIHDIKNVLPIWTNISMLS